MKKFLLLLTLAAAKADETGTIAPFFQDYCTDCHGEKKQKGKLTLHDLPMDFGPDHLETWRMIEEQIRFHDMPPEDERQPADPEREVVLKWIKQGLLKTQQAHLVSEGRLLLPEFGNHIDHEALFSTPAGPVIPGPPRLWRLRPELYESSTQAITDGAPKVHEPALRQAAFPPDKVQPGKDPGSEWVNAYGMVFCWCPTQDGGRPANPWGIHDLYGNLWEWTRTFPKTETSPKNPGHPIACGGSWVSLRQDCAPNSRREFPKRTERNFIGFRLVLQQVPNQ
ncbi:MAG: SUMF1/EgtB/PvdO family nonheme iron enzyme [Akkermansiaceae bacterium]